MSDTDNLLTIKEAADLIKVHWQTIRTYIKEGKLQPIKIGKNIRIRESELLNMSSTNSSNEERDIEIEIRFQTDNRQEIEKKLMDLGAKVTYHSHIIDHWFVPNNVKNLEQNAKYFDSGKGFGLRIREQDNDYQGKVTTTLEVKRLTEALNHNTCEEHEIDINSYAEAKKLLRLMNMKEFITIDKDRVVYTFGEFKIAIDEIKNFGTGVEIEMMSNSDRNEVIERLRKVAVQIGLELKDEVEKTVTYLAMRELSVF